MDDRYLHYGTPSAEWVALVASGATTAGVPAKQQDVEELQTTTNASREAAASELMESEALGDEVMWHDVAIPTRDGQTVPGRVYRRRQDETDEGLPVVLFFHGGGFLFGTIESEIANCARIVRQLPALLVHVCYRHTPKHKHPTQLYDAWDAFEWVTEHCQALGGSPDKLIVSGISAGGALAASVCLQENKRAQSAGHSRIQGQILGIPWLYHPKTWDQQVAAGIGSYFQNKDAPILPRTQVDRFTEKLSVSDPLSCPLFVGCAKDEELVGLPKSVILVAGMDPLRDEALLFEERLKANKVSTKLDVFAGLPHGFYRYTSLSSTTRWFQTIGDGLSWILQND